MARDFLASAALLTYEHIPLPRKWQYRSRPVPEENKGTIMNPKHDGTSLFLR
jgi:hypothetical protein